MTATEHAQEREWRALSENHARLCRLVQQVETTASVTAAEAQALLDAAVAALEQAEGRTRQISRQANEAVYYLQFGDIVRQKTEHIAAALNDAADLLATAAAQRDTGRQARAVDELLRIQISQLEAIRTEVGTAQRQLGESFHRLAQETLQLKETLQPWQPSLAGRAAGPDPLESFRTDLRQLETLHDQGQELRRQARHIAHTAVEAATQLGAHVDEVKAINADIHLRALNAIVKTATLDSQGATLSVLSMQLDGLYRQSNEVVNEVVAILESILRQAGAVSQQADVAESASGARLQAGMPRIDSAYQACRETSASAGALVDEQQTALGRSQALLAFLGQHGAAIEGQIQELTAFRQMLAPRMRVNPVGSDQSAATPTHRYTMQSEREIHERARQATVNAAIPMPDLPSAEPPACVAAVPPPNPAAAVAGPVPVDEAPSPAATARLKAPDDAWGDNVELF